MALKGQLLAALAAIRNRLDGCLRVELAPHTDFFHWAWNFIPHNWRWLCGYISGLWLVDYPDPPLVDPLLGSVSHSMHLAIPHKLAHYGVALVSSVSNVEKVLANTRILLFLSLFKT